MGKRGKKTGGDTKSDVHKPTKMLGVAPPCLPLQNPQQGGSLTEKLWFCVADLVGGKIVRVFAIRMTHEIFWRLGGLISGES